MPKKQKNILHTAAQLKKDFHIYLKESFQNIQYECQEILTSLKNSIGKNQEQTKKLENFLKRFEKDLESTKKNLKKKATKTLQNKVKTISNKIKKTTSQLKILQKEIQSFKKEVVSIKALKIKEKAREAANKLFDKSYKAKSSSTRSKVNLKSTVTHSKALMECSLKEGDQAPDFTSVADDSRSISLSDYRGKFIVLYFYPKDDTPGCTQEAKDFTKYHHEFSQKNAIILGVSPDSLSLHREFKVKHHINYTLLADTDKTVAKLYGVIKNRNLYGKSVSTLERSTFLIDESGIIQKIWRGITVIGHAEEVLNSFPTS